MILSENFIVGDSIKEKLPDMIDKIKKGKKSYSFYCITEPSNPKNLLDIYCYAFLFGRYYKNFNPKIIALAGSEEEAISLVVKMTQEVNIRMQESIEKDFGKQFREYLKQF
ncbi:MAG: hypothetical protein ACI4F9_08045 [Lachnospiraceae bacterium]